MSTNYVTKEYLIKNFQNFADKLKTIYQKQENVEFHVVDSYSKLASNPKVSMVSYVINDETVGTDIKKKGFYYYDIKEATPKWIYIEISGGNGLELKPWISGGKDYSKDEYVVYDYKLYQANKNHTSSANFELDKTNWNLIIGGNSYEVFNWKTDYDYVVGDKVNNDDIIYKCIKDHHSDLVDFKNDEDNWIIELDKYFSLSQNQYNQMVTDGLITNNNKELFIVNNGTDISSSYEESFVDKKDIQIQHNLKCKYPMIRVFDTNDNELYMDIEYYSDNLTILHSEIEISGKVIVNKL